MKLIIADSKGWFKLNNKLIKKHRIKTINSANQLTYKFIKSFNPDFIFFPHWNKIVPSKIHNKYNCIAFHTAPLPYGRGGSPIQNLILRGFKTSPICALNMSKKLDAGPIYSKKTISLGGTLEDIFKRSNIVVNELIFKIINNKPKPKKQVGKHFVFKRLKTKDNLIPQGLTLKDIYDRVRMLDHPKYPSAFIKYGNLRFEFSNAKLLNSKLKVTLIIK